MSPTVLLLSIRPQHAVKVFDGNKTVELRRIKPRVKAGDFLCVYVSSPVKALYGVCEVTGVVAGSPHQIWEEVCTSSGVTHEQFNDYYTGAACAFAIVFKNAVSLPQPLALACLKQEWKNFTPPQSYRYLSKEEISHVGLLLKTQTGECFDEATLSREEDNLFSILEDGEVVSYSP